MRADSKTYEAVAVKCDSFSPKSGSDTFSNSTGDKSSVSCTNCNHFTDDKHCELDLYDQIIVNHKLDK